LKIEIGMEGFKTNKMKNSKESKVVNAILLGGAVIISLFLILDLIIIFGGGLS
jgi:hypothetical protein